MIATREWVKSLLSKLNIGKYSTNEVRIGTWIDGKPLYRKVIDTTSYMKNVSTRTTSNVDVPENLQYVVRCEFHNDYTNWAVGATTCYYADAGFFMEVGFDKSINKFYIVQNGDWITNLKKAYLIVEYTKTTD